MHPICIRFVFSLCLVCVLLVQTPVSSVCLVCVQFYVQLVQFISSLCPAYVQFVSGLCPVCVRFVSSLCPVCVRFVSGLCPVCVRFESGFQKRIVLIYAFGTGHKPDTQLHITHI